MRVLFDPARSVVRVKRAGKSGKDEKTADALHADHHRAHVVAAPVGVLGLATLLLWLSGDWRWVEGWIFGVWWAILRCRLLLWLRLRDPALLAERMRMPGSGGESRSDVAILLGIKVCFLASLFVSALDVRFGWTPVCRCGARYAEASCSSGAVSRSSARSPITRMRRSWCVFRAERGQHVIDTGVYGFVRHPMYLGASLMFVGAPLLLGSVCGFSQPWPHGRAARSAHLWRGEAVGTRSGGLQGISPEGALPVGTTRLVISEARLLSRRSHRSGFALIEITAAWSCSPDIRCRP
jgi:hypothetical protein